MKYYYKVVSRNMESAIVSNSFYNEIRDLSVKYKVGEWVRPKVEGSQLMVFESFEDARRFAKSYNVFDIYKCEISGITKKSVFVRYPTVILRLKELKDLWKKKKNRKKINHHMDIPPQGTVFCSAVKLIEKESY